jgi:F-type H+-transporting ATPase subunit epsilon
MASGNFTIEVVTPTRLVLKGTATEAQIPVLGGYIGVLPGHTPLLAEMGYGELTCRMGNHTTACTAMGGFVEVLGNRVIVLADRAELAEEIDVPRAQTARDRAAKRLATPNDRTIDAKRAQAALERAQVRLKTAARGNAAPSAAAHAAG